MLKVQHVEAEELLAGQRPPKQASKGELDRRVTVKKLTPKEAHEAMENILERGVTLSGIDPSQMTSEEVAKYAKVDTASGLTSSQAKKNLERDGFNELDKVPKPTFCMLFIRELTSFIIILLFMAAFASVIVNAMSATRRDNPLSYSTGVAILVLVMVNAGIAAYFEYQAGDAVEKLAELAQASIDVLRDGQVQTIETKNIVRGDIVLLGVGDVVPADMRLIEADDLKVCEMPLTGESEDVKKVARVSVSKAGDEEKLVPENMVFSSCEVKTGKARGIAVDTGMRTRIGRIAELTLGKGDGEEGEEGSGKVCGCLPDHKSSETPLQRNIQKLGARIGVLAVGICVVLYVVGGFLGTKDPADPDANPWIYMILIAVTLAVAAIPEGIPLCVTISLTLGCQQMANSENVLVKKIAAVETLGSASVICSDKTGTLTEGKMTMVKMWSAGTEYKVAGKGFDPNIGKFTKKETGADANKELGVISTLFAALMCSNTKLNQVEDPETHVKTWEPKGNSSEAPIVVAARKVGLHEADVEKYPRVVDVPFSSERKMMLTVSDVSSAGGAIVEGGLKVQGGTKFLAVCKGAPNIVLEKCTEKMGPSGSAEPMSPADKASILKVVDAYSSEALRVLAIAVHPLTQLPFNPKSEDVDIGQKFDACAGTLQLIGLVASIDPDRDGVPQAVDDARGAGIRVVMITGDYLKTAKAIAKNVRIIQPKDDDETAAVDCSKLRPDDHYLPKDKLDELTANTRVFARAKPEDKLEIVKSLQRQGLVSAMTGDGVNDAPALSQAEIGVAMGIQGTEVAKGASDMILMDDNFVSIVKAIEKGRTIYAGIQKFVAFIMSVHIAEVIQIFACVVASVPIMRNPLQILFLILVTDLPPSIALGMEPGEKDILKHPPRDQAEPVVLPWMWISIVANGLILSGVIIGIYLYSLIHFCHEGGKEMESAAFGLIQICRETDAIMDARTVAFISLVFCENVRAYVSRSFDKPVWVNMFGNPCMQLAVVLAIACMMLAIFCPFLSDQILSLRGWTIGVWGWLIALAGPLITLVLCELFKLVTACQMRAHLRRQRELQGVDGDSDEEEDDDDSGSD